MFVVDTNVLVYASNRDAPGHEAYRSWIEARRSSPDAWFLTWGIIYEFLRVATHPHVLMQPMTASEAQRYVDALLASPGIEVLVAGPHHQEILRALLADMPSLAGNIWHDAHTAVLMREHGVRRIATRDTGFYRFGFLEPFDPVP